MTNFVPLSDFKRFARAAVTNQLARFAPDLYLRITGQTGRGEEGNSPPEIADYFLRCFEDYRNRLSDLGLSLDALIQNQSLLEYGPGDLPGVALLMYAHGARSVTCADRFAMVNLSATNLDVLRLLLKRLPASESARAAGAFNVLGEPGSGFRPGVIDYLVTPDGCVHQPGCYALVYSRAVLEHVNDLQATFGDMESALLPGGIAMHEVDLKSHGLHRETPLDFLCWSDWAWSMMHSNKGVPNRLRIDRYRLLCSHLSMKTLSIEPVEIAPLAHVQAVRNCLATPFRNLSDDELTWLSFWMILQRPVVT